MTCESRAELLIRLILFPPSTTTRETKNVNVTVSDTAVTDVKFDNLYRERAYKFLVYSQNLVGYSPNASEVFVPSASNSKASPPCAPFSLAPQREKGRIDRSPVPVFGSLIGERVGEKRREKSYLRRRGFVS